MIDFPDAPALNDTFSSGGRTWKFDGSLWRSVNDELLPAEVQKLLDGASLESVGAIGEVTEVASVSGTKVLDTSVYNSFDITMTGDTEFSFTNPAPSGHRASIVLTLRGGFVPTLPPSVVWAGGAPPTFTGMDTICVFTTTDGGSTWLGTCPFATAGGAFAPDDITGIEGWWDASDAGSFTYSSGTLVSQWEDLSGNGRHLTQATTGNQPSRNATVNGLDAVQSDTSDDFMSTGSWNLAQPFTVFAVAKRGASIPAYAVLWQSISGTRPVIFAKRSDGTGRPSFYAGTLRDWSPVLTSGELFQFATIFDGASSAGWKNGASESLAGSPGTGGIDSGFRIGSSAEPFGGIWCELIIYDTALGTTDRQAVEGYLQAKWGTP